MSSAQIPAGFRQPKPTTLILQELRRTRGHCCHCVLKTADPTAAWAQPCSTAVCRQGAWGQQCSNRARPELCAGSFMVKSPSSVKRNQSNKWAYLGCLHIYHRCLLFSLPGFAWRIYFPCAWAPFSLCWQAELLIKSTSTQTQRQRLFWQEDLSRSSPRSKWECLSSCD